MVKEPELRFTPAGLEIASLYMVAGEKYKDKETNLWIGATAFGKTAELISKIGKGQRVNVFGKLQTDEWNNAQGEKQSRITMIVESFEYIEKRDDSQTSQQQSRPQPTASEKPSDYAPEPDFDDDLPFSHGEA